MRRCIAERAQGLELGAPAMRVPAEKYHLTILFLGEVAERDLSAVRAAAACGGQFTLRFDRCEHWAASRVLVAAASRTPGPLEALRSGLEAQLAARGIAFDGQPLVPHITIARKVSQPPVLQAMSEFFWTVRAFHLVASAPGAAGSIYTVVDTWPLLDEDSRDREVPAAPA